MAKTKKPDAGALLSGTTWIFFGYFERRVTRSLTDLSLHQQRSVPRLPDTRDDAQAQMTGIAEPGTAPSAAERYNLGVVGREHLRRLSAAADLIRMHEADREHRDAVSTYDEACNRLIQAGRQDLGRYSHAGVEDFADFARRNSGTTVPGERTVGNITGHEALMQGALPNTERTESPIIKEEPESPTGARVFYDDPMDVDETGEKDNDDEFKDEETNDDESPELPPNYSIDPDMGVRLPDSPPVYQYQNQTAQNVEHPEVTSQADQSAEDEVMSSTEPPEERADLRHLFRGRNTGKNKPVSRGSVYTPSSGEEADKERNTEDLSSREPSQSLPPVSEGSGLTNEDTGESQEEEQQEENEDKMEADEIDEEDEVY
ncbi:hypothetical protein BZA77DRAFT_356850 [Pyronema omphalodes]|nr:hypothetical protein BZA77DRAFT_357632 [Pyronema omphalodes]KAI5814328.1 hypothetical protein BZA77DRAFT_356850 [Pyronema omphalodes]